MHSVLIWTGGGWHFHHLSCWVKISSSVNYIWRLLLILFRTLQLLSHTSSLDFRLWAGVSLRGWPQGQLRVPWNHAPPEEEKGSGPARRWLSAPSAERLQAWLPSGSENLQQAGGTWISHPDFGKAGHEIGAGFPTWGLLLLSRLLAIPQKFLSGSFDLQRIGEYSSCHWSWSHGDMEKGTSDKICLVLWVVLPPLQYRLLWFVKAGGKTAGLLPFPTWKQRERRDFCRCSAVSEAEHRSLKTAHKKLWPSLKAVISLGSLVLTYWLLKHAGHLLAPEECLNFE